MPNDFVRLIRALAAVVMAVAIGALLVARPASPMSIGSADRKSGPPTSTPASALVSTSTPPPASELATTTPSTSAPVPAATTPPLALPSGKGMWIYQPQYAEQGDPVTIVTRAKAAGLTHLYVRMGSSVDGFTASEFLDALLPVAHAAQMRIIGWDFPYLENIGVDVTRALEAIQHTTPTGDRIDGFSADIETRMEYVWLTAENAALYGATLRANVGPKYPLIATVPRPSPARQVDYPYADVVSPFDAIAPMVYWINAAPNEAAAEAMDFLAGFGKPVLPIGQAYDGSYEGGPPGTPTPADLDAFINTSYAHGAAGVSFWSWQHASDDTWNTIAAAPPVGVKPTA
jgi:hypothetical protein